MLGEVPAGASLRAPASSPGCVREGCSLFFNGSGASFASIN